MDQFLNLRESANRHIKAEQRAILSISRGERIEILYCDAETAERKAHTITNRFRGTGCPVQVTAADASVYVRRV